MEDRISDIFASLGERLAGFGRSPSTQAVIAAAVDANTWFTPSDIIRSVEAIRTKMLDRPALDRWLEQYPTLPAMNPANICVIMPGNIPLVGFFDLLCVLAAGHRCFYKLSSKDSALMDYVVSQLRAVWPDTPAYAYIGQPLDGVIATGSDNSKRYFRNKYKGIPAIFRGSRSSAAVLAGDETYVELRGLASDIFSYSGLGCRNVSHLVLPRGYDPTTLLPTLNAYSLPNPKYRNNFLQRSAVLEMQGIPYIKGEFFLLREEASFPSSVSEITYRFYDDSNEVRQWLSTHDEEIQCVVGREIGHPRIVGFGESQSPSLTDYPDGADVMRFLSEKFS